MKHSAVLDYMVAAVPDAYSIKGHLTFFMTGGGASCHRADAVPHGHTGHSGC